MRRSKWQIIAKIIEVCDGGANKTKIVYRTNVNFKTVNGYLDLLMRNGLIIKKDGHMIIYETTPAGTKLLNNISEIQELFSES